MPIYEYECTECGHNEEVLQRFSDEPLSECPKCHGKMKKLMSMNSFQLKGSGWYVTDYASKRSACSSSPSSASEGSGKAKEAPAPSSKSEASGGGSAASSSKE